MNTPETRPVAGCHFRVELVDGTRHSIEVDCAEVLFPLLSAPPETSDTDADAPLVLRRATTADTLLHDWWAKAHQSRTPQRRTVHVTLLAPDHERVVRRWRFNNARPLTLHYTPLNAMQSALVMESLAIAFDSVAIE